MEGAINYTGAWITIGIVVVAFIFFLTEWIPLVATAMGVPVLLVMTGVLPAKLAFADFANQWTLIFMFMFMMGEALFRTGFADKVGRWAVEKGKGRETFVLVNIMTVTAIMSAFLSNTGTTICFLPIILAVIAQAGFSTKRFMMCLAFASSFGGTMTLIGTPPNGVVQGILEKAGLPSFGFFEYALIGLPICVIGIAAMVLIGVKFLPSGMIDTKGEDYEGPKLDENMQYRLNKMPVAVILFAIVIFVMAAGGYVPFIKKTLHINLLVAACAGAMLVIATKCITWKEATESVSWTTVFLFACMFPVSTALQKTGGVLMVATAVNNAVSSPYMLLVALTLVTVIITQFASNTATCLIVAPIGIASAKAMAVSPAPILMAIAIAASLCFMTPIATPPNTIVLGPGKLSFMDYVKAGWFPQVLSFVLVIVLVPLIWRF